MLNFVKALKEMETIDIDQIQKIIALSHVVQEKEAAQQTKDELDDVGRKSLLQRVQQQLNAPVYAHGNNNNIPAQNSSVMGS